MDGSAANGRSEVVFVRHVFRSSPTRYFNRADGTTRKDGLYSLIDYLNPEATRAFLKITHETYKQPFGDEFGKTVLGFFGDEPDYTCFMPWTPKLLDEFRQQKGYDLQPYLPLFFAPQVDRRGLARRRPTTTTCGAASSATPSSASRPTGAPRNNVEYLVHLNHEELMLNLLAART